MHIAISFERALSRQPRDPQTGPRRRGEYRLLAPQAGIFLEANSATKERNSVELSKANFANRTTSSNPAWFAS